MKHVLCKSSSPELSFETFQLGGNSIGQKSRILQLKNSWKKVRLQILIKDSKPWMNYSKAFEIVSNSLKPIVSLVRKLAFEPI